MASFQPELWVERARSAVGFYEAALDATVLHKVGSGDDIVAQFAVGEAIFWVGAASPEMGRFSPLEIGGATSRTLLVVDDPESALTRATVADEHGWRLGRIRDPFGHEWEIGKPYRAEPRSAARH